VSAWRNLATFGLPPPPEGVQLGGPAVEAGRAFEFVSKLLGGPDPVTVSAKAPDVVVAVGAAKG